MAKLHITILLVANLSLIADVLGDDTPPPTPPPVPTTPAPPPPTTPAPPPPTTKPPPQPCMCTGFPGTFCGIRYKHDSDFKYLDGDYVHPDGGCSPNALYFCGRNDPYAKAEMIARCPQTKCRNNPYDDGGHDDCLMGFTI